MSFLRPCVQISGVQIVSNEERDFNLDEPLQLRHSDQCFRVQILPSPRSLSRRCGVVIPLPTHPIIEQHTTGMLLKCLKMGSMSSQTFSAY